MLGSVISEKNVLGSLIVDTSCTEHIESLSTEDFTVIAHKNIFKEILRLNKMKKLDIVTLIDNVKEYEINASYITELAGMSYPYSIKNNIETLKEKTKRRKIISQAEKLIENIAEDKDVDKNIYEFENNVKKIADSDSEIEDDVTSIASKFLDFIELKNEETIKFGIKFLDETIGGLYKSELTTIAAKSGVGKTALALLILRNCLKQNKKVLLISREMSDVQMFMRNVTSLTGISSKAMKNKAFTEDELSEIVKATVKLTENNNLYINDNIHSVSQIKRRIRQIKPDLVIIDYLQLLTPERSEGSREREVATLSREIKNMTLDFDIPIIQLSQLNDEMKDYRPFGERPMRDSKAIYHDSNNVIYIHRPVGADFEDACKSNALDPASVKNAEADGRCILTDIIVAKNRDGNTSMRQHWYVGKRLFFQDVIGGGPKENYPDYKKNKK